MSWFLWRYTHSGQMDDIPRHSRERYLPRIAKGETWEVGVVRESLMEEVRSELGLKIPGQLGQVERKWETIPSTELAHTRGTDHRVGGAYQEEWCRSQTGPAHRCL